MKHVMIICLITLSFAISSFAQKNKWKVTLEKGQVITSATLEEISGDSLAISIVGNRFWIQVQSIAEIRFVKESKTLGGSIFGCCLGAMSGFFFGPALLCDNDGGLEDLLCEPMAALGGLIVLGSLGSIIGGGLAKVEGADDVYNLSNLDPLAKLNTVKMILYMERIRIREQTLGEDHIGVARSLTKLGEFYRDQGQYSKAEPLYKRALAIAENSLGRDHLQVATIMNNLAALYGVQGKYAEAEPLYIQDWEKSANALGPNHPDVANVLENIAELYQKTGRTEEAIELEERAKSIRFKNK